MSPKYCSLAIDEAYREFDSDVSLDNSYEPDLRVIVNAHYGKTSTLSVTSSDVLAVKGRITVSF